MKDDNLVSVIIPVFNVRPYLSEALDSVVHQTYKNIEIIIIDDGSTDGSETMCDDYAQKDSRVCVVHQKNRGLSNARNVGLNITKGNFVAFIDSDDVYHPDFIASMMEKMIQQKTDLVLCQYTVHKTMGRLKSTGREKRQPKAKQGKYDRITALRALADGLINESVWNKLYRRELWNDIRFPDGHVYEDSVTTYRVINNCQMIYVMNQPLYLHRKRPGSITDTWSIKNFHDRNLAYSFVNSFIEANTPDVFSIDQAIKKRQESLNVLLSVYLRYYSKIVSSMDITKDDLKTTIIEEFHKTGTENFTLRTKVAYWMLKSCPFTLRIIYTIYRPARLLIWLIIRK